MTLVSNTSFNEAYLHAHKRLDAYFHGSNEEGAVLQRTNPLLVHMWAEEHGDGYQRMFVFGLYIPSDHQVGQAHDCTPCLPWRRRAPTRPPAHLAPAQRCPPTPNDLAVLVVPALNGTVFARSFKGLPTMGRTMHEVHLLKQALEEHEECFVSKVRAHGRRVRAGVLRPPCPTGHSTPCSLQEWLLLVYQPPPHPPGPAAGNPLRHRRNEVLMLDRGPRRNRGAADGRPGAVAA